jgi:glycosyltransferase involved in cell wall biosynthesis
MKVLITSPSLDENENVSGISTMISSIIEYSAGEFIHFKAGRKDNEKSGVAWLAAQLKLPFAFRKAIKSSRPDIVHINTAFEPRAMIRDMFLAMFRANRPLVVHVHGGRFVMEDFPSGGIRTAATRLLRAASKVVVLSETERDNILRRVPGLDITVLANAVAARKFPDTEREWGTKNIVYLGRLQEAKGLSEMVEACRVLVAQGFKFKFTCFGTGPDKEEFTRRMTSVLGENFYYGGVVSGRAKVEALNAADVFLMPSRFEGLPLALLEAMAAGCVPIVSDRGAIPSVVEDGRNGFLVGPGDITQIVGKLKFLLSEGQAGWEEYRRNARETVRSNFDMGDYTEKLKNLYSEIVSRENENSRRR